MTYHSDHKTNLKPSNLQFRQKTKNFNTKRLVRNWTMISSWNLNYLTGYSVHKCWSNVFSAGNRGNHKSWVPSMQPHNLSLIFMGMKQKKNEFWMIGELMECDLSLLFFNPKTRGLLGSIFSEKWSLQYQIFFQMKI